MDEEYIKENTEKDSALQAKDEASNGVIRDRRLILIAVGLLVIGTYFAFAFFSEPKDSFIPSDVSEDLVEEDEEFIRSSFTAENISTRVTDNRKYIGIGVSPDIGDFFIHPQTGQTLYVRKDETPCDESCLIQFVAYTSDAGKIEGDLGYEMVDGNFHHTWKGNLLYTFIDDAGFNSFLGDGAFGAWMIANP